MKERRRGNFPHITIGYEFKKVFVEFDTSAIRFTRQNTICGAKMYPSTVRIILRYISCIIKCLRKLSFEEISKKKIFVPFLLTIAQKFKVDEGVYRSAKNVKIYGTF